MINTKNWGNPTNYYKIWQKKEEANYIRKQHKPLTITILKQLKDLKWGLEVL